MRPSPRTARLLAAVLALACVPTSQAADAAVAYSWRFFSGDGRIDQGQAETTVPVPLLWLERPAPVTRSDSLDLTGPAQTSADVTLSGRVDPLARSLGVHVSAHAKVNPYDPDDSDLDPVLFSTQAMVQAGFHDRVTMFDPTVLPGAPISFKVQPLQTSGRMDVTPSQPGGPGGVASFMIGFGMENVVGSSLPPATLSDEHIILSGSRAESTWDAASLGGLAALAGGALTVPNGSVWDVSFVVRVAVQALPGLLPASNPQGALSEANFFNTVHWGGIGDVVDGEGRALTQFSMQSSSGFDWTSPVPEPGTWWLLATGLLGLAGHARRLPRA